MAVGQAHGARWEGRQIAAGPGIGDELPEHIAALIGFDDAAVASIGDKGTAFGQPASKGDRAEGHPSRHGVRVHNSAWRRVRDIEGLVVVFVGNQDVAVTEELGRIGTVEEVRTYPADAGCPVLPHDGMIRTPHFDDALVALIRD